MTAYAVSGSKLSQTTAERTTLTGGWLWFARVVWVVVAATSLALFAVTFPLVLNDSSYGDWTIEASAQLFGLSVLNPGFAAYALALLSIKYLALAVFVGVACYIFWRKSNDWMAILVSLMLLVLPHTFSLGGYTENWYYYPDPWGKVTGALSALFNSLGFLLFFLVFCLFPDGRFVPPRTRWLALVTAVFVVLIWLNSTVPFENAWVSAYGWYVFISIFVMLLLLATWSQVYRYQHVSTPTQQTQTRLVVLGLVTSVTALVLLFAASLVPPLLGLAPVMESAAGALVTFVIDSLALVLLPLAFGGAMLRDRLWQSDRVLSRAFVYVALSGILLVVYVAIVGALSEVFRSVNNFVIAAIATGVVALLFQPLRERLQQNINRFLYGERQEPFRVLHQLGNQLEQTLTPEQALPLIVETIARTMRVPYVAIMPGVANSNLRTEYGTAGPAASLTTFPLRYQNEPVGELVVARRAPNEAFSNADLELLTTLARQAGSVAYTAHLNAALRQSRERIITEREQERRRLRRDLHDGLGPTLASQTLKLDAAMDLLNPESDQRARGILQDVKAQTQGTVSEIRRIVYELRPPALDDLGLVGALDAYLAQVNGTAGTQITLQAPKELPALSAAVQVNAYRIVLEAVHNVIKHAHATHCVVRLAIEQGLKIQVTDDGVGIAPETRSGVGLAAMRERAEELGGRLEIEAVSPHGTRITATLPLV